MSTTVFFRRTLLQDFEAHDAASLAAEIDDCIERGEDVTLEFLKKAVFFKNIDWDEVSAKDRVEISFLSCSQCGGMRTHVCVCHNEKKCQTNGKHDKRHRRYFKEAAASTTQRKLQQE